MWCSILIYSNLTEIFDIEIFSGAKGVRKVYILIIIYCLITIIMRQLQLLYAIYR